MELREENSEYIAEKRKEAVDAVTLLQDHVAKRVEVERANNGAFSPTREYEHG